VYILALPSAYVAGLFLSRLCGLRAGGLPARSGPA